MTLLENAKETAHVLIRILSQMWEYMKGHTLGSGPEETQDITWRKSWLKRKLLLLHIERNSVWAAQTCEQAMRRTKFRLRLIATSGKCARSRMSGSENAQLVT